MFTHFSSSRRAALLLLPVMLFILCAACRQVPVDLEELQTEAYSAEDSAPTTDVFSTEADETTTDVVSTEADEPTTAPTTTQNAKPTTTKNDNTTTTKRDKPTTTQNDNPTTAQNEKPTTAQSPATTKKNDDWWAWLFPKKERPEAEAYLAVFQRAFPQTTLQKSDFLYIGLDWEDMLYEKPDEVKALINEYAAKYDVTVLWEDFDSLKEHGYIIDLTAKDIMEWGFKDPYDYMGPWCYMKNGTYADFHDLELTNSKLVVSANFAMAGQNYTAEKIDGKWVVDSQMGWIV